MSNPYRSSLLSINEGWSTLPGHHLLHLKCLDPAMLVPFLDISPDGYLICDTKQTCLYTNRAASAIFDREATDIRGQHIASLFPQKKPDAADQFTLYPDQWSTVILRSGGEKRELSCIQNVIESQGEWFTIILIRDVTEQRQLERKALVLAEFAPSMACADSLQDTLNALARSVVQTADIVACMVPLISGAPPRLHVVGSYGLSEAYIAELDHLVRDVEIAPPTLRAFEEQRVIVTENVRQTFLANPHYAPIHQFLREVSWDTLVCIPLIYRGQSQGVFTVYCPPGPPPDKSEIAFFAAIADQAAVAVENARLLVAVQEKAALEERQRLARELHDSVSQGLYGITLGAQAARASLETDHAHSRASLDYVISLAKATHVEMRSLIFALRPESLASEGIVEALARQAEALSARYELQVETQLCHEPVLPLEVKEALYRIAQEALHNVVRHARACRCQLSLYESENSIVLEVRDNGVGFDPLRTFPGHLGLHSMRERAMHLGGSLEITSLAGQETCVRATIPLSR